MYWDGLHKTNSYIVSIEIQGLSPSVGRLTSEVEVLLETKQVGSELLGC